MLWIVRELLSMKEFLLTGAEYKLSSAVNALENPIGKFHGQPPFQEEQPRRLPRGNQPADSLKGRWTHSSPVSQMRQCMKSGEAGRSNTDDGVVLYQVTFEEPWSLWRASKSWTGDDILQLSFSISTFTAAQDRRTEPEDLPGAVPAFARA